MIAHARGCTLCHDRQTVVTRDRKGRTRDRVILYEIRFTIIFYFTKRPFMFSQHLSCVAPSYFSRQRLARVFLATGLKGIAALSFLCSRCGALRLCYASRTDERGRNGRGGSASEGRGNASSRAFIYARVHAREPTRDTRHASSIMKFD